MSKSWAEFDQYYRLLDLKPGATAKDVTTAYRLKALKLHPDKNPDDPQAQQKFHQLTEAYQILCDPEARAAYDDLDRLRKDREARREKLDLKRREMQDDLLDRERAAKRQQVEMEQAEALLQARISRLREEALRAKQDKEIYQRVSEAADMDGISQRTLVATSSKTTKKTDLEAFLRPYDPSVFVVADSANSLTAQFSDTQLAEMVYKLSQTGTFPTHLTFSWLSGLPPKSEPKKAPVSRLDSKGKIGLPKEAASAGFEAKVLEKLRLAQEKKLAAQSKQPTDL